MRVPEEGTTMTTPHQLLREKQRQLEDFRRIFRSVIATGNYPPEQQQRLYHVCKQVGLDWNEARRFVRSDAEAFLARTVQKISANRVPTPAEQAEIEQLRRRLGLNLPPLTADGTPRHTRLALGLSSNMRRRLASVVAILVFCYIGLRVLDHMRIVMWVHVPWWGFLVMAVLLFIGINYMTERIFK